jgi:DNA (cytosine-5)-methyltransferase 1
MEQWHPKAFQFVRKLLSENALENWLWIKLPLPTPHDIRFADIIENNPTGVDWHTPEETQRLLNLMSPLHRSKVEEAQRVGTVVVGTIYKRTRADEDGVRQQRAEVRFDGVAGCLRTPTGGSSRQIILVVEGESIRSRLLSPRETARLMGLPEDYPLPVRYNNAYHLAGDGVAVPVVAWLRQHLIEPALIAVEEVA